MYSSLIEDTRSIACSRIGFMSVWNNDAMADACQRARERWREKMAERAIF